MSYTPLSLPSRTRGEGGARSPPNYHRSRGGTGTARKEAAWLEPGPPDQAQVRRSHGGARAAAGHRGRAEAGPVPKAALPGPSPGDRGGETAAGGGQARGPRADPGP